jgi:hypothetical protein
MHRHDWNILSEDFNFWNAYFFLDVAWFIMSIYKILKSQEILCVWTLYIHIRLIYCKIKLLHIRIINYLWIILFESSEQNIAVIIGSVFGFRVKLSGNVPGLGATVADCVLWRCLWRRASSLLMLPTLVALIVCASTVGGCLSVSLIF